jgi:ribonuclease HII
MILSNLKEEKRLWKSGFNFLVGLDEVGRGAIAGPVVAGACAIYNLNSFLNHPSTPEILKIIKDSKKMNPNIRNKAFSLIYSNPYILCATYQVGPNIIDKINIRQATILAMKKAALKLINKLIKTGIRKNPQIALLIDGIDILGINLPKFNAPKEYTYIKGDSRIFLISTASVVAKVTRDRIMEKLAYKKYKNWAFEKHKGYATSKHIALLRKYGLSPIHRKTFLHF